MERGWSGERLSLTARNGPREILILRSPLYCWHSVNNGKAKYITAKLLGIHSFASGSWFGMSGGSGEKGSNPQGRREDFINGVKAFVLEKDSRGRAESRRSACDLYKVREARETS